MTRVGRVKQIVLTIVRYALIRAYLFLIKVCYVSPSKDLMELTTTLTNSEVCAVVDLYISPCRDWYVLEPLAPRAIIRKLLSLLGLEVKPLLVPIISLQEYLMRVALDLSKMSQSSETLFMVKVLQPLVCNLNVVPISSIVQTAYSLKVPASHRQYVLAHRLFQSMARSQRVIEGARSPYISIREGFLCLGVKYNSPHSRMSWQSPFAPIDRVPLYRF